jgi:iron-sulfur cluster insertion protein
MFTITDPAAAQIKEIAEAEGIGHTTVRVRIVGGGCAGFSYDMYYEDKVAELDEIIEKDGIKVVIDPISMTYMENVTMDYSSGLMGQGFRFINPDSKGSCGCGKSFDA